MYGMGDDARPAPGTADHADGRTVRRGSAPGRHRMASPAFRTGGLTIFILAACLVALPRVAGHAAVASPFHVPWWWLVVPFAATETFVFHLEIYREAHSFSFSEIPLVIALFFANPMALIVGRLV